MLHSSLNYEPDKNAIFYTHFFNHERGQDLGGTPLHKPYRYVPPQRVGLLGLVFWSENTLLILVWNQVWFSRKLQECTCMNIFIISVPNDYKKEI